MARSSKEPTPAQFYPLLVGQGLHHVRHTHGLRLRLLAIQKGLLAIQKGCLRRRRCSWHAPPTPPRPTRK